MSNTLDIDPIQHPFIYETVLNINALAITFESISQYLKFLSVSFINVYQVFDSDWRQCYAYRRLSTIHAKKCSIAIGKGYWIIYERRECWWTFSFAGINDVFHRQTIWCLLTDYIRLWNKQIRPLTAFAPKQLLLVYVRFEISDVNYHIWHYVFMWNVNHAPLVCITDGHYK